MRTNHTIRPPCLVNTLVQGIGGGMRVICAITPVRDQIPVVLQHVEMVIRDDALHFFLSPLLGLRYSQIDRLSLEGLRFPVLRKVGHHPSANSWIASVQGPVLSGETRLSPIDP